MSDPASHRSNGDDSGQIYPGNETSDEKKGEDSWTDVSLNDDSETKSPRTDNKGMNTTYE